jgi:phage terminase Nu1 subunit (DNA packaging protein)
MKTENEILADLGFAPSSARHEATEGFPPVALPTLAKALGLTVRAVNQLAVAGLMVKLGHGQYDLIASTRNYCEKMRKSDGGAKDRLTLAQAELAETKLAEARKELVPADQVQATWDSTLRTLRSSIMGIPARVQAQLSHLTAHDVSIFDREIRDTLTELGNDHGND